MEKSFEKTDSKTEIEIKNQNLDHKLIAWISFDIDNEDQLNKEIELIKLWYNRHWFYDREVLIEQVKKIILNHIKVNIKVDKE